MAKWWQDASLGHIDRNLDECDQTQMGVLAACHRLIREVEQLREEIDALKTHDSLGQGPRPWYGTDHRIGTNRPMP